MNIEDWTIDTGVLYQFSEVNTDSIHLLNYIKINKHKVAFDDEKRIKSEYEACLKEARKERKGGLKALEIWLYNVAYKSAIEFSGRLTNKQNKELMLRGFKQKDTPFVAVSYQTTNKRLVIYEDRHYNDEVKSYLKDKMGISVLTIQNALGKIRA